MAPRRPTSPRKLPTQARAKQTVDAILRASAHVLRTRRWDGFTTNAVAQRAGVSIGSLYQYFPSKEALLTALADRHAEEGHAMLVEAVETSRAHPKEPLRETVHRYLDALLAMHAHDPELHRVLVETLPALPGGQALIRRRSAHAAELVRAWLELHRKRLRKVDLDVATFVLLTSVEAVAHLQVVARPASLTREVLVNEVSHLVCGYLGLD